MVNCKGLDKNLCELPDCLWVNKKRKYCRTSKNKKKKNSKSNLNNQIIQKKKSKKQNKGNKIELPKNIHILVNKKKNKDLLFSIMYSWFKNKNEIDDLDEDIDEIIWKEIADHGFEDADINMEDYDKLVDYLKKLY